MTIQTLNPMFFQATFQGRAAPGPISVPGLKVGDQCLCWNHLQSLAGLVENVVTVDDEIQYYNNLVDGSALTGVCIFMRPGAPTD